MTVQVITFALAAAICVAGALGVVLSKNPVHSALSLVGTLFGVAVLFIAQDAQFLAAVQVIVYAGAIVVLFLFVIMLLGVDQAEDLESEPLPGQRIAALVAGVFVGGGMIAVLCASAITGKPASGAKVTDTTPNINQIAHLLFTDYLFAFEITSALLVIAVVGAVVLARRRDGAPDAGMVDADLPADELDEAEEKV